MAVAIPAAESVVSWPGVVTSWSPACAQFLLRCAASLVARAFNHQQGEPGPEQRSHHPTTGLTDVEARGRIPRSRARSSRAREPRAQNPRREPCLWALVFLPGEIGDGGSGGESEASVSLRQADCGVRCTGPSAVLSAFEGDDHDAVRASRVRGSHRVHRRAETTGPRTKESATCQKEWTLTGRRVNQYERFRLDRGIEARGQQHMPSE